MNLYPQNVMSTLDGKEFTPGIIKSGVKMEQPCGIVIRLGVV